MIKPIIVTCSIGMAAFVSHATVHAEAISTCVDLSAIANWHYQDLNSGLPTGSVTLGGVPFQLPNSGVNGWLSIHGSANGSDTVVADLPVGVFGVTRVSTLMNTMWGQVGPYTKLEFFGEGGAYYVKELVGNSDIRDWLNNYWSPWLNDINNTTTTSVWSGLDDYWADNVPCRIDKQAIDLPSSFAADTLSSIRITDWGHNDFHRAFLIGVTVTSVPEPGSVVLVGVGTVSLLAYAWRRRRV